LTILTNLTSLTSLTILVTLAALEVLATEVAFEVAFYPELNNLFTMSMIHPISKIMEAVASTSSQKKNENKYPHFTYEAMIISREKRTIARQVRKYQKSSMILGNTMTHRSSMKRVYTVTIAVNTLHCQDSMITRPTL
jgi:hypothetical protein